MPGRVRDDNGRWLQLFLRIACRPDWSFKFEAKASPSINTIARRLELDSMMLTGDELEAAALSHQTIMMKAAARLRLTP